MKKIAFFITILTLCVCFGCNENYKFTLEVAKKTTLNTSITISLTEKNNKPLDKIQFFINGQEITADGNTVTIKTADYGVGKHQVSALAFYPGKTKKINNFFEVFADVPYQAYTYKIINTYPHDTKAYTQGLEYYNGFLYETTGRRGQSTLRKVDYKTGKVLKSVDLDKKYFGEGMTILNNKIYWLTWENKKGFVYNLETFEQESSFDYDKSEQGWGLTNNGSLLIKSDGTTKIWFLDSNSKKEIKYIQAYTHKQSIPKLNELEYINGKIYANYYLKPLISIINPETGVVEGIVNLSGLKKEMEKTQKLVTDDEVLNGIAFDKENNRLFVTGKNWGKLFEIELVKK
ncbi:MULTISPECIES: glutaminyl-peptide cyclotransferase [unclassified Polaribacter]|uniref:glutaminyl-peptide cyclotransferase n=1 Tax=unclassified Polaribacter TaxID=196858 RepID=UPI0011BE277B|nr:MULTISPECIES: glutaminyl-peptide cyclotransferase [unclassified Polaribacter]TXD54350.1 glutaminyl-peptide cyclotransferase [Polaribacter sp. IC063]TXD62819.1 glutaminyl-peptide cyclotransferase [Polaribacter sp. IC066]